MLDYLFYRFYDIYKKKEGDNSVFSATAVISFIQFIGIVSILFSINVITNTFFSENYITNNVRMIGKEKLVVILLLFNTLLIICNYIRYRKKISTLILIYSSSPLNKKLKTWILYLIIPFLMGLPFVLRYILKIVF